MWSYASERFVTICYAHETFSDLFCLRLIFLCIILWVRFYSLCHLGHEQSYMPRLLREKKWTTFIFPMMFRLFLQFRKIIGGMIYKDKAFVS